MEEMKTLTFPDGSQYEVVDATARVRASEALSAAETAGASASKANNDLGGLSFGVDGDGNYGYYGADGSLIPFRGGILKTWEQPVLSENGVLGGESFAVYANVNADNKPAWQMFDDSWSTYWQSNAIGIGNTTDLIVYNPNPLRLLSTLFTNRSENRGGSPISVYGSNDNLTWDELILDAAASTLHHTYAHIHVKSLKYYKYYKFVFTAVEYSTVSYVNCTLFAIE